VIPFGDNVAPQLSRDLTPFSLSTDRELRLLTVMIFGRSSRSHYVIPLHCIRLAIMFFPIGDGLGQGPRRNRSAEGTEGSCPSLTSPHPLPLACDKRVIQARAENSNSPSSAGRLFQTATRNTPPKNDDHKCPDDE